jgi:hypothetical protein
MRAAVNSGLLIADKGDNANVIRAAFTALGAKG